METKQIVIESPVTISGLTITPVTATVTYGWQNKGMVDFFGLKRPLYILISGWQSALKVFSITGQESSLEQIVSEYPELGEAIKKGAY